MASRSRIRQPTVRVARRHGIPCRARSPLTPFPLTEQGVTVTHDEVITVTVKPHSSTMLVAQTAYNRHYGKVRINYGNRVDGHYICACKRARSRGARADSPPPSYLPGYVPGSQDVPNKNDIVRTTVPLQCGQAPESVVKEWNADPTKRRFNS